MASAPSFLIVSKDDVVQRLIADVPFLATGVLSLAVVLLLILKRRINIMTSMIMLSSCFGFAAAMVD